MGIGKSQNIKSIKNIYVNKFLFVWKRSKIGSLIGEWINDFDAKMGAKNLANFRKCIITDSRSFSYRMDDGFFYHYEVYYCKFSR